MTMSPERTIMPQRHSPHGLGNRIGRVLWSVIYVLLFRFSPRPLHRWRNILLRLFGAKLHPTARVYPRAKCWLPGNLIMDEFACVGDDVDVYCVAPIRIGAHSTVSQYSYLCAAAHDFEDVDHPLTTAPITIGRRCWIAADVFVGPGVTIGEGTVVGVRSTVLHDLPAWMVAAGTPAKSIRDRRLGPSDFGETPAAFSTSARPADSSNRPPADLSYADEKKVSDTFSG